MLVLHLTYTAPLDYVDALLPAHVEWLDAHYAAGMFIASGRQEPRTGGVILAVGERAAVEAAVAADPFVRHGVCAYTVTEFIATKTAPALADYRESLPG